MEKLFGIKKERPSLIIILLAIMICLGTARLGSGEGRSFLGYSIFVVSSASMEPSYPIRTLVIAERIPFENLEIGDAIVYKSNALGGKLAFHRITRIVDGGVYTKGDNNQIEDKQLITDSTFVGKSVYSCKPFF